MDFIWFLWGSVVSILDKIASQDGVIPQED